MNKTKKRENNGKAKIRSMTGFGKGTAKSPYGNITVEIKTLNHKHLSVSCAPFEGFFLLEEKLKNIFENSILRGKVFVKISRESSGREKPLQKVRINKNMAGEYLGEIKKLKKEFALKGEIGLRDILYCPGVVEQTGSKKEEKVWPYVMRALQEALKRLIKCRENEGARLARDFRERLKRIQAAIREIKKYQKKSVEEYRGRLSNMVRKVKGGEVSDKSKLEEEVALFARNYDTTEEVVRLKHHVDASDLILRTSRSDVGKKLDFIAQEMHREANTIGAKSGEYKISNAVIEIKSEIEKIREQLKNIE